MSAEWEIGECEAALGNFVNVEETKRLSELVEVRREGLQKLPLGVGEQIGERSKPARSYSMPMTAMFASLAALSISSRSSSSVRPASTASTVVPVSRIAAMVLEPGHRHIEQ